MSLSAPVFSQVRSVKMGLMDTVEVGTATGAKAAVPILGHFAHWAPPLAAGAMAAVSEWDHHIEKKRITREYDAEIASRLGKPIGKVTIDDMEKVAKENPVINEAVKRSAKKRNLNIGVTLVGVAAAVAIAGALVPVLAPTLGGTALAHGIAAAVGHGATSLGVAKLAVGSIAGILGFLGVETPLNKIGEKVFHLSDPDVKDVKRNPALQSQLSVANQISYLGELQSRKQLISQEQVMTVFVSANKELGRQIEARYGDSFDKLNASAKIDAMRQFGEQFAVRELTEDINKHHLRVQELAFAANGQASGLVSVGDVQRANAAMQKRLDQLNAQLDQMYAQQGPARTAVTGEDQQQTAWRQRILAERQQQAAKGATISV